MATVAPDTSSQTVWLVNAAFLQEMKDSNPHLWHESHRLRTLSQLEPTDCESPQKTIKSLAQCLDGLRDLVALQFTLEESYGLISTAVPKSPYDQSSPEAASLRKARSEVHALVGRVIDQHRCLYLQIVDLVEQAEELQYRGCDASCLRSFVTKVERFSQDFTAHERLEAELIRADGSLSRVPASAVSSGNLPVHALGDVDHAG